MDSGRRPFLVLVAIVLGVTIAYAGAAQLVSTPRVHPDEHIYAGAAASLAEGDGLRLRHEPYQLGPLYPAVLAPILAVAGSRVAAYPFYKVANALLFALAAFPIYLVARRLLRPWWSVGVAAFSIAIPSSMYVALVMTESVSYLTYSIALWAVVLALERPTTLRQLGVLGAVALAYATRAQFAVLFAAYVLALAIVWAVLPGRPRLGELARRLWPTLGALGLAALALLARSAVDRNVPARRGRGLRGALPRLRPARHRQVERVPRGRPRALPRGRADRRGADRARTPVETGARTAPGRTRRSAPRS